MQLMAFAFTWLLFKLATRAMADHFVLICGTCNGPIPAHKAKETLDSQLPEGFSTSLIDCMAGCDRPMTVGLQANGKAQYLFGDIQSPADLSALAEFAHQFRDSEDGWTSASTRPLALYTKTLSRMPCLPPEGTA
jgi:predicted metal-binding protein